MAIDPAKPYDIDCKVDEEQNGMRLDKFIAVTMPRISRTKIKEYNKLLRITVNDQIKPDNWRVKTGDIVILKCRIPEGAEDLGKNIPLEIIYDDEYLIGVNKQAGLVVHPVALHRHNTMMNALYWKYKDSLNDDQELTLVNRIDQYTSGVVLACKDLGTKRILQEQFEARSVSKSYLAIVEGKLKEDAGEINLPLGPKLNREIELMIGVRHDEEGKPSKTIFEVIEKFTGYTLVKLIPHTGRQHQLRVHMAEAGHPLAADHLYGDNKGLLFKNNSATEARLDRFALHAEKLTFRHPVTEKEITITAPLPKDMAETLTALRENWDLEKYLLNKIEYKAADTENKSERDLNRIYGQSEFDRL
ncbi:MAG: RluA family pseudouridine synthase [Planctomycetota bacterium]|jgi:23S rRNA pseudouridine1911/1915/1917 synthase